MERRPVGPTDSDEPIWAPELEELCEDIQSAPTPVDLEELLALDLEDPKGLWTTGSYSDLELLVAYELGWSAGRSRGRIVDGMSILSLGVFAGGVTAALVIWFLSAAGGG